MKVSLTRSGGASEHSLRISPALVVAGLALLISLGGIAQSAIPGPDGNINACYVNDADPDFSYLYLRDHDKGCRTGEQAISWTKDGGADPAKLQQASASAEESWKLLTQQVGPLMAKVVKAMDKTENKLAAALSKKDLKPFKKKQRKSLMGIMDVLDAAVFTKQQKEELFGVMAQVMRQVSAQTTLMVQALGR